MGMVVVKVVELVVVVVTGVIVVVVELEEVVLGAEVVEMTTLVVVTGIELDVMVKLLGSISASCQGGSGLHVLKPGMVLT